MPVQVISHARSQSRRPRPVRDEHLRFGFTLDHVERLALTAVRKDATTRGMAAEDRREAAWFGAVNALYSAAEPPTPGELYLAAVDSLRELWRDDARMHGCGKKSDGTWTGRGAGQAFARYWLPPMHQVAGEAPYATAAIDRLAVRQIFSQLTSTQREVLLALAVHEDHREAARALRVSYSLYMDRLDRARKEFIKRWHEPEAPSRLWRRDRRAAAWDLPPRVAAVLSEDELPSVVLPDARETFTRLGTDRMHTRDLLSHLARAKPGIYGRWDQCDLAAALRSCGVPPTVHITIGRRNAKGYRLSLIEQATDGSEQAKQGSNGPCEVILARWLDQEQEHQRRQNAQPCTHQDMIGLIMADGPAGTRPVTLKKIMPVNAATIQVWLAKDLASGTLTRNAEGRYVVPAPDQEPPVPARTETCERTGALT